jgi:hypothetical protein
MRMHQTSGHTLGVRNDDFDVQKFYKFVFRDIYPLPCLPMVRKTKCTFTEVGLEVDTHIHSRR